MLIPATSTACESYVIGFRGKGGAFDVTAFNKYVGHQCSKLYNADQTKTAIQFIQGIHTPYELYGFSLGAQSVATVLRNVTTKPNFVLTIGAYHSTDVNFDRYNIKYKNYFDASGRLQKSPGTFVLNVEHMKLQEYVNTEILK